MIYISDLKEITPTKSAVGFIHCKPFDVKYGLKKTQEELEIEGFFVENLPEEPIEEEKHFKLFANPSTKKVWYEEVAK